MFVQGDKLNLKYDIGIVVVDRIPFNQYVSRVRVSDSIMVEGLAYTTSGWGVRNHTANVASGMPNSELQGAYVIAGKDSECAKSPVFTNQTSTPICTYNIKDFENGGCFGDAGSGLFVVNLGGAMDLMGVRSYSVLGKDGVCAGEGALEYYTRVSLMLDFIKDVTGLTEEDVKAPPIYVYYNKNSPASDAAERTESSTSDEPVKQKYY
ncbi:hypothetical protein GGI07_000852 [Coemansia sp. Benny D115]|nr:hypothetical protein GGI07_000852 [Coemansia sp. Benny D115]